MLLSVYTYRGRDNDFGEALESFAVISATEQQADMISTVKLRSVPAGSDWAYDLKKLVFEEDSLVDTPIVVASYSFYTAEMLVQRYRFPRGSEKTL